MAFVIADRVQETSTTTGTGTLTLAGAVTGYQTFAAVGNANTCTYAIFAVDGDGIPTGEWETGIGTYTVSGTTLSRGVIESSNANALVNFAAGTKRVIVTAVAKYAPLVMETTANRAIQVADQVALGSTSGNARGSGAVDLQIRRTVASNVASGPRSVIAGGFNNKANSTSSTVCGGKYNTATNSGAFVGGGYANSAGQGRSTVCGGFQNNAGAVDATVGGGYGNKASATGSAVLGGLRAKADKYGQQAHASGRFAADGDAQRSWFVARRSTTTATQSEMVLDGASGRMTIANDTTWVFDVLVVARRTDADDESAGYRIVGVIDNNANTVALVGSITVTTIGEDNAAWDVDAVADNTNKALVVRVTGEASKTIRWVAAIRTAEVTG